MIKLKPNIYEGADVGYSQFFGENPESYEKFGIDGHNGIDIPIASGTKLYSAVDGVITEQANDPYGYGNYVKIENDSCGILYAHLSKFVLKAGDKVKAGDLIGYSGNSGNSTGPHLHFAVFPKPRDRSNGYNGYIDPLGSLVKWEDSADSLEAKVEELRKQREEYRKEITKLKENIAKCAEAKEKFALDAKIASATIIELEDQHKKKIEEFNQIIHSKTKAVEELEYELSGLSQAFSKLKNELESLKAEKQAKLCDYSLRELIRALFSCR